MNNWKEQIHLNFGLGSSIKRIIPQKIPNPNMMPIQSNCDIKHDIQKQLNMNYADTDFDPRKKVARGTVRKSSQDHMS